MKIFAIILAGFSLIVGFRLLVTAIQTAISGNVLVRRGRLKTEWQPAPTIEDAWKTAFRDGLMGLLLIALGLALFT
ncbi:MAG TPA: hypothetical protein VGD99_13805 [Anaerolineae bacterium]